MGRKKTKYKHFHGNKHDNEITGTDGNDEIEGRGGDDTIYGLAGDDQLWGDSAGSGSGKGSKGSGSHKGSGKGSHKGSGKGSHKGSKGSGSAGDDYLDGGAGSDELWAGAGNDEAVYDVGENAGARDKYDGGKGTDTLLLRMSAEEYQDETFQNDLVAYLAILADEGNHKKKYQFQAFDLKVQNFEELDFRTEVDVVDDVLGRLTARSAFWIRKLEDYVYFADVLANDIGVTVNDDGLELADGIEIRVVEDSIPPSLEAVVWDEEDLVFAVFMKATSDGNDFHDDFKYDFYGGENDPAGVTFEYEALQDGMLIDTATVTLI